MDVTQSILSDITTYMKYSKYVPELNRRETWEELVTRNKQMHQQKFPQLKDEIEDTYKLVYEKKVLPSMRSLQFAGKPIELNNARIFNCSFLPIDDWRAFSEIMFLLLSGCGVGYSVQTHHIDQLPEIKVPTKHKRYLVGDSIEGWADAVRMLCKAYFQGAPLPTFDFRDIRAKGAQLITVGGKAPGPEPLKECLFNLQKVFDRKKNGDKLTSVEAHDMACHIADAVLSGGIRRAALISLFDLDDEDMLTCKFGNWWEENPQRGRANNSAVVLRHKITEEEFFKLWKKIELSGSGEPGIYFSNDKDWGTNPCCEIGLRPYQFCNLCDVNVSDITSQEDLNRRVQMAAFFGTLQAGFTDFHYLRPIWSKTTAKDALLGIGMTGIGSGEILKYDLEEASRYAVSMNIGIADTIGINHAARVTCIKPSGTTSCVLGTASGIHAWHNDYYLRTVRFGKNEAIATYLTINHPELCEDDVLRPQDTLCVRIPIKAPEGSIYRTETAIDTLERVKKFSQEWIKPGHINGDNTHNVSATISIDKNRLHNPLPEGILMVNEWDMVGYWMWWNRDVYNGLSVLPYFGGSYKQAPFEDITKEEYEKRVESLKFIDLNNVIDMDDTVDFGQVAACAGGAWEIHI